MKIHPRRSPKIDYTVAFLLGGLIGLLFAVPARAAEAFRSGVSSGEVLVEVYSVPEEGSLANPLAK